MPKVSVVINTFNEENNIEKAIKSVKWADEILICDMHSSDKTVEIAKKNGARVVYHQPQEFVELARNFAISKANGDWILVLDPDEEIGEQLAQRLQNLASKSKAYNFIEIPRKNIIFNKWIKNSGWWSDYQVRFFKKGSVEWKNTIHSKPNTTGVGLKMEAEEKYAIIHNNYKSVGEYIEKMNRYTKVQAEELVESGYKFKWQAIFEKPLSEFLSRYFANYGYKDGLHGLSLSLLQAFSFLVLYLKVWEKTKFVQQDIGISEFEDQSKKIGQDINFWIKGLNKSGFKKIFKLFKK